MRKTTLITSPSAPANAAIARCQRRSPVRSEWRATITMTTAANAHGIADSRPIVSGLETPVCLMIVGSQKLTPYSPITNAK